MSDFDVVRVWLDNVDASHFRGTDNDPYGALDRIEAENEGLRAVTAQMTHALDKAEAEIARLREALEAIVPSMPAEADNPQEAMARAALSSEESA